MFPVFPSHQECKFRLKSKLSRHMGDRPNPVEFLARVKGYIFCGFLGPSGTRDFRKTCKRQLFGIIGVYSDGVIVELNLMVSVSRF